MQGEVATPPRRVRVERNIYRRADGKLEVGYRDLAGRQRWKVVEGGIDAARALVKPRVAHRRAAAAARRDARRSEEAAERITVEREITERERKARVRDRANLEDAYSYLRQAAQAIDRAQTSGRVTLLKREAATALYKAEDLVAQAIRESV